MLVRAGLGIEESTIRSRQLVADACEAIRPFGGKAESLKALARYVLERNS